MMDSVGTALLEMTGVRVWTPEGAVLLRGIDWRVQPGQHWALLGPNGAGKSTLLRIAAGVRHPSAGSVQVLGRRLGRVDIRTLWPHIGFVDATHATPGGLDVADVVLTGASGTISPIGQHYGDAQRHRAASLLELMGAGALAGRAFGTCSDGERARVRIARALMPAPRLLLLDEPTAGLDMAGREGLLAALAQLASVEPTLASVVVCHHLEDLPVTTSHALLLAGGASVACGGVEAVLAGKVISACFGVDVHVSRAMGRWSAVHAPVKSSMSLI